MASAFSDSTSETCGSFFNLMNSSKSSVMFSTENIALLVTILLLNFDEIYGFIFFPLLTVVLDGDVPMLFLDGVQCLDKFGDSHDYSTSSTTPKSFASSADSQKSRFVFSRSSSTVFPQFSARMARSDSLTFFVSSRDTIMS